MFFHPPHSSRYGRQEGQELPPTLARSVARLMSPRGAPQLLAAPCGAARFSRLIFIIVMVQAMQKTIVRHCLCYDMAEE